MSQNKKTIIPVIHSYVTGNIYVGITDVEQYVGLNKPQLPQLGRGEYLLEIHYNDDFMQDIVEPIIAEIKRHYSATVAANVVSKLLLYGLLEATQNYEKIQNEKDFQPTFKFGNTKYLPNFTDIYKKLIEYFPHKKVDLFCDGIAMYGVKFVREVEDKRCLFGNEKMYANLKMARWNGLLVVLLLPFLREFFG